MGIHGEDLDKKVNVNGSGISLGHPIGASDSIRLTALIYEMVRCNAKYGLFDLWWRGFGYLCYCGQEVMRGSIERANNAHSYKAQPKR